MTTPLAMLAAAALVPPLALPRGTAWVAPWRAAAHTLPRMCDSNDDGELDADDTVSSWDEQLAEMRAWEEANMKQTSVDAGLSEEAHVDEEAHFGFGDDDETSEERAMRQLAEKQASLMLGRMEGNSPADSGGTAMEMKRMLTSIEAVLNAVERLSERLDVVSAKVDKVHASLAGEAAGGAPASDGTPAAPEGDSWDGNVDEEAWFDDDPDEDLPDWRDVRRLKRLLEEDGEDGADADAQ
jgi:hypothetical protein